jgi:hypothetical protein
VSSTFVLVPQVTVSVSERSVGIVSGLTATNARGGPVIGVPEAQLYYWTRAWQENERAAVDELERGEGQHFASAKDAIRWLLSDED